MFKGTAVVVSELPAGRSRILAMRRNGMAGRDDASLRTKAEYLALYDLLCAHVPPVPPAKLRLLDEAGRPTAAARAIEDYIGASLGKPEFFDVDMYMFHVTGFRRGRGVLTEPVKPGLRCPARRVEDRSGRRRARSSPGWRRCRVQHPGFLAEEQRKPHTARAKAVLEDDLDAEGRGNQLGR